MSELRDDLNALGLTPQLDFVKDNSVKIIYLKLKPRKDERISATGSTKVPDLDLPHQNKTLKPITRGVRFRLVNRGN